MVFSCARQQGLPAVLVREGFPQAKGGYHRRKPPIPAPLGEFNTAAAAVFVHIRGLSVFFAQVDCTTLRQSAQVIGFFYLAGYGTRKVPNFFTQENSMSSKSSIDEQSVRERLEFILQEIHENEDPDELNAYRAMFRKNVSLFHRSYVAAYLLKNMKGVFKSSPKKSLRGDLVTLFIGIGKSRRVFPKDLIGLILDTTSVKKENIGAIKILENYSFVEVAPEDAENLIGTLNGMTYRGRTLNVNYAKKKD